MHIHFFPLIIWSINTGVGFLVVLFFWENISTTIAYIQGSTYYFEYIKNSILLYLVTCKSRKKHLQTGDWIRDSQDWWWKHCSKLTNSQKGHGGLFLFIIKKTNHLKTKLPDKQRNSNLIPTNPSWGRLESLAINLYLDFLEVCKIKKSRDKCSSPTWPIQMGT